MRIKSCFFFLKKKKQRKEEWKKDFLEKKEKWGWVFPKRLWENGATWEAVREVLRVKSGKGEEKVFKKSIKIKRRRKQREKRRKKRSLREV